MAYNGSGTFLINTAGQPVVAGTVISSTTFNALTADLATGLSTVITKDGQTTVTANIPMASFKFTGLGVGSAAGDSANLSQVQSTVTKLLASVSGADTVTATASPTLAAYAAGQMFYFVAAGDNTTSVTLNIDALGAKAVTRDGSVALAAADIKSGEVVVVVYDGTRFQVVSQLNSAGNATFANVSITSALNVGGVATFSAGTAAAPSITTTGDTNTGLFFPAADTIAFTEGGVESMRIDSSANVGIGTSSPTNKLNVSGNGYLFALNGGLTNRVAQIFGNTGGGLDLGIEGSAGGTVFTSGSSYAGVIGTNNATVLQLGTNATIRATLDTSGNLGIQTAGTTYTLGSAFQLGRVFSFAQDINSGYLGAGWFGTNSGTATYAVTGNYAVRQSFDSSAGAIKFFTAPTGTAGNAISFTQAMTLDASGNLLVGTTSGSFHRFHKSSASDFAVQSANTSASVPYGHLITFTAAAPNDATSMFLRCDDTSVTGRIQLRSNGGLANYSANDVNLSDERTKKDIAPLGSMWDKFKAIEIVKFKYRDQTHDDDNIGVIAQQVESVAPEFVDIDGFGETPEDGVPFKTVYTTDMYHAAIKALQEAMARIETLEAKVTALESK